MSTDEIRQLLSNWPWLVVALLVVWPILHFLYNHRISGLKEDLERLRARLDEQVASSASAKIDTGGTELETILKSPDEPLASLRPSPTPPLPSTLPHTQTTLGPGVWAEIMAAYRALPPLERESGLRAAYGGTVIRGTAVVSMVWESVSSLAVLVVSGENEHFILSFSESRRAEVGTLREGDKIQFEGRFRSVGHMHIELEDPKFERVV